MKHLEKIITKELLRKVLPKETENLSEDFSFYIDEDYIIFSDEGEQLFDYNIYKFAFKCKEMIYQEGYKINSYEKCCDIEGVVLSFKEDTEVTSIIKATIWLIEDKALK